MSLAWAQGQPAAVKATDPTATAQVQGQPVAPKVTDPSATIPSIQSENWRQANANVGQFLRGHADVLKWEQANLASAKLAPSCSPVLTQAQAVSTALQARSDMQALLYSLGQTSLTKIQTGALDAQDLQKLYSLGGAVDLLKRIKQTQKSWVQAVYANQLENLASQDAELASIGADLAERMAKLGNWSVGQTALRSVELFNAQNAYLESQISTHREQRHLLDALGQTTAAEALPCLPSQLSPPPALPEPALMQKTFTQQMAFLRDEESRRARMIAQQSQMRRYQIRASQYQLYRGKMQPAQETLWEAAVQNYNGMFTSTWDLLEAKRKQLESQRHGLEVLRALWLAQIDVSALLAGLLESNAEGE